MKKIVPLSLMVCHAAACRGERAGEQRYAASESPNGTPAGAGPRGFFVDKAESNSAG